jgi:hypothetical protein
MGMSISRKIAWEKFTHLQDTNNLIFLNEPPEDIEYDDQEDENSENGVLHLEQLLAISNIKTPFGVYDISDPFSPYNMFECWIGHTNFRITKSDFDILNRKVDGIGCLKILSPYRFFIGIEKMFTFPAVRIHAQSLLCGDMNTDPNEESVLSNTDPDTMINDS